MDRLSQETFDSLVKLDPDSLTEEQASFLRARRSYMTKEQKRVFGSIVAEVEDITEDTEEVLEELQPKLKKK